MYENQNSRFEEQLNELPWPELLEAVEFERVEIEGVNEPNLTFWQKTINDFSIEINVFEYEGIAHAVVVNPLLGEISKKSFIIEFVYEGKMTLFQSHFGLPNRRKSRLRELLDELGLEQAEELRKIDPAQRMLIDDTFASKVTLRRDEIAAKSLADRLEQERALATSRPTPKPKTLQEILNQDSEDQNWVIVDLMGFGWTVFLVAAAKVGKTTMMTNLVSSLVSGDPFLGRFETEKLSRKIAIMNFELTEKQMSTWLIDAGLEVSNDILIWGLRGEPNPFRSEVARDEFVSMLKENNVGFLIVDPFSKAFIGDSMRNDEVKDWLLQLERMKTDAGVDNLFVLVHAGRDGSKSRGASALDDHPDAIWYLERNASGLRFFRAIGRDVDVPEESLSFETGSRQMTMAGANRKMASETAIERTVYDFIVLNPGCSAGEIESAVIGSKSSISAARKRLIASGRILESPGLHNSKRYAAVDSMPPTESQSVSIYAGDAPQSVSAPFYIGGHYTDWLMCSDCGQVLGDESALKNDMYQCDICGGITSGEIFTLART